ncbi:thioesterase family protein [Thermodesulforhabdus norvegica]|uniref:Thioesterase superfamily n=1 Tax=Thermodesulforhabdus norvegica TaxID=39841 RepID=A0A1I4QR49_9BACT|nr:thioesterase family protein [Thermodesulforhabdus norvegica]SFM42176.1 Thioesterase superfamily [Thermodesulforhabdus norvegica]
MRDLNRDLEYRFTYTVPEDRTVPYLLPESSEFQAMPRVLASGFMIGIIEWACIKAVNPYLDWPKEQTVGIGFNLTHSAATPPGMTVTINVKLLKVEGRKLTFQIEAFDEVDTISEGIHERFIIYPDKFAAKMEQKLLKKGPASAKP